MFDQKWIGAQNQDYDQFSLEFKFKYQIIVNRMIITKKPEIVLKNGQLSPSHLQIILDKPQDSQHKTFGEFIITIIKTSGSESHIFGGRKYIFAIEELEQQQTQFISEGQSQTINWIHEPGNYHLYCVNYPKLRAVIVATNNIQNEGQNQNENERLSNNKISLNLEAVEEVKSEKEDENKQQNKQDTETILHGKYQKQEEVVSEDSESSIKSQSPFGTPKKAEIQDYDKILSSVQDPSEDLENRYIKYFKQEFKLWRNFFQDQPTETKEQNLSQEMCSPIKEKPKSQRRKNSDSERKEQRKEENWSKRENLSPNLFTESCGSPSYNENLSDQEKSVGSYLYSHQEMRDRGDEELYEKSRTMKKTNSQYRLAVQDIFNQQQTLPDTEKKKNSLREFESKKISNMLHWVDDWCEREQIKEGISIKVRDDRHIVNQWLSHLRNKYKLSKFLSQ